MPTIAPSHSRGSRTNATTSDGALHDGGLRLAVGVQLYQVTRGIADTVAADGTQSIIRHHPMLTYFKGHHLVQYLPGENAILAYSRDARSWRHTEIFPKVGTVAGRRCSTHNRMAFYHASNGRLLASTFYGIYGHANDGTGFARVAREIKGFDAAGDIQFGPTYAVMFNDGYSEANTPWQPYTYSDDETFKASVIDLLACKLYLQQWYEEHRKRSDAEAIFVANAKKLGASFGGKAFSWWTLPDGRIAAVWKGLNAVVTKSGESGWTPENVPNELYPQGDRPAEGSLAGDALKWHGGSKVWGQRTSDGRYALVGNAQVTRRDSRRFPLVVRTSVDGLNFTADALSIASDVPMLRYPDHFPLDHKDSGLQYVHGVTEGNSTSPDGDMWLTYSSNKEDIWIARVPVGIRGEVTGPVNDDFQTMTPGADVTNWNIRTGQWATVGVVEEADRKLLRLTDRDPYDYAKAIRVFEESQKARIECRVRARQRDHGVLYIDVTDARGRRPVQLALTPDGQLRAGSAKPSTPLRFPQKPIAQSGASGTGPVSVATGSHGTSLKLSGNTAIQVPVDYTITPNTVLFLEFRSTCEGDRHTLGLVGRRGESEACLVQLFGRKRPSSNEFFRDYIAGSGWREFWIDIGHLTTGQVSQLVFGNEGDAQGSPCDSHFRNVVFIENVGTALPALQAYEIDQWLRVAIDIDAATQKYDLTVNDRRVGIGIDFAEAVSSIERVEFRTGEYMLRDLARRPIAEMFNFAGKNWVTTALPGADTVLPEAVFDIEWLTVSHTHPE